MDTEQDGLAPVVANRTTGEVSADIGDDQRVAPPNRWVSSFLWIILVVTCSLVTIGSAGALIVDFLAPSANPVGGSKETILLIFTTSFQGLIALFVTRPGSR